MRRVGFAGVGFILAIQGCTGAEAPKAAPEFETSGAGISHSSSGGFSNVPIPAGTTIWFTSEVRYSGLPNQVVHLYSNGSRITFVAGGVSYNLVVPDGVVTIDPRLNAASTTFNTATGEWQTNVPMAYGGQTFVSALAWVAPVNLPGSITNVVWTTNLQSELAFNLTWQWSAATYSSFTTNMTAVGVKPIDNQWINPYPNSDMAGTPENFRNRLIPGARTGGGTNYIGVPVTMAGFTPDTPCAGVSCTPNAQCQTASSCDVRTGQCVGTNRPNNTACNDGNACTTVDSCQAGACVGASPVVCTASDQCHVAGVCNPASGQCSNPSVANGVGCNDGNACTTVDSCQSGVCTGASPVVCTAANQCHVAGVCNPTTGQCSNPNAADGLGCSDGNLCTTADSCQNGVCTGASPVICAASDQCHVSGLCDPSTGQCTNPPATNGVACNDGNACTSTDWCQSGVCTGASFVQCAASDACHVAGVCDPSSGQCSNPVAADGVACSDGNGCTQSDSCQAGVCVGASPVSCASNNVCFTARCEPSTGLCAQDHVAGSCCGDGVCDGAESGESCPGDCWLRTRSLVAGPSGPCAILEDGSVRCLGANQYGQRGIGSSAQSDGWVANGDLEPRVRLGQGHTALSMSVGTYHACAVLEDHSLKCWGNNEDGRLGLGDTNPRGVTPEEMGDALPSVDLGAGTRVLQVSAGSRHTCALLEDHRVKCWGSGSFGQLGLSDLVSRGASPGQMGDALPAVDFGSGRAATRVVAAADQTCAILDDRSVRCWGQGFGSAPGPALDTGGYAVAELAGAEGSWCLLREDQRVACFGGNSAGQLGLGDNQPRSAPTDPVDLGAGRTVLQLAGGPDFLGPTFCALLDDRSVKCWGSVNGQFRGDNGGEMGDALPRMSLPAGRNAALLQAHRGVVLDDQSSFQWWWSSQLFHWGLRLRCGNGRLDAGEVCDDGDLRAGDGCSPSCTIEPGFSCQEEPSYCRAICGDGMLAGPETCDDGGVAAGDGCSPSCAVEPGWVCEYPSQCRLHDVRTEVVAAYASPEEFGPESWTVTVAACNAGADDALIEIQASSPNSIGWYPMYLWQRLIRAESCVVEVGYLSLPPGESPAQIEVVVDAHDSDPSNDRMLATLWPAPVPLGVGTPRTTRVGVNNYDTVVPVCNLEVAAASVYVAALTSYDPILDAEDAIASYPSSGYVFAQSCDDVVTYPEVYDLWPGRSWIGARVSLDPTVDSNDVGALGNSLILGPDFVIRDATTTTLDNGWVVVSFDACNQGTDHFPFSHLTPLGATLYTSSQSTFDGSASFAARDVSYSYIRAATCFQFFLQLDASTVSGLTWLYVTVDDFIDGDPSNNLVALPGPINVAPDAEIQVLSGDRNGFQVEVCNRGLLALTDGQLDFVLSTDATVDASDPTRADLLHDPSVRQALAAVLPGGCRTVAIPTTDLPTGQWYVGVAVLSGADANLGNNIAGSIPLAAGPDLSIARLEGMPSSAWGGEDGLLYFFADVCQWSGYLQPDVPSFTMELIASDDDILDPTDLTIVSQTLGPVGVNCASFTVGEGIAPLSPSPGWIFARIIPADPDPDLTNNVAQIPYPL